MTTINKSNFDKKAIRRYADGHEARKVTERLTGKETAPINPDYSAPAGYEPTTKLRIEEAMKHYAPGQMDSALPFYIHHHLAKALNELVALEGSWKSDMDKNLSIRAIINFAKKIPNSLRQRIDCVFFFVGLELDRKGLYSGRYDEIEERYIKKLDSLKAPPASSCTAAYRKALKAQTLEAIGAEAIPTLCEAIPLLEDMLATFCPNIPYRRRRNDSF